jgi:hypothetical protein
LYSILQDIWKWRKKRNLNARLKNQIEIDSKEFRWDTYRDTKVKVGNEIKQVPQVQLAAVPDEPAETTVPEEVHNWGFDHSSERAPSRRQLGGPRGRATATAR